MIKMLSLLFTDTSEFWVKLVCSYEVARFIFSMPLVRGDRLSVFHASLGSPGDKGRMLVVTQDMHYAWQIERMLYKEEVKEEVKEEGNDRTAEANGN